MTRLCVQLGRRESVRGAEHVHLQVVPRQAAHDWLRHRIERLASRTFDTTTREMARWLDAQTTSLLSRIESNRIDPIELQLMNAM